jgi:hypothetical protein
VHVPLAVDVGTKSVRALARFIVEIAAGDHILDRQPDAVIERPAQLEDVGVGERLVEACAVDGRRFLKERIVVMPRPQLVDADRVVGR